MPFSNFLSQNDSPSVGRQSEIFLRLQFTDEIETDWITKRAEKGDRKEELQVSRDKKFKNSRLKWVLDATKSTETKESENIKIEFFYEAQMEFEPY